MKTSELLNRKTADVRLQVENAIKEELTRIKQIYLKGEPESDFVGEIDIPNPPIFQYIDDQFSEVIGRIDTAGDYVVIDTGSSLHHEPITELSHDQLIYILKELEGIQEIDQIEFF